MNTLVREKTAINKIEDALDSRPFRRVMAVAYGLGASIVILGALFKITHLPYANQMLFVGMVTEAIIFALSALQKPHVEPDWSKVHPQFLEDYHGIKSDIDLPIQNISGGHTGKLDAMLQNASIDQNLIDRLGTGLKKLSETTGKLNEISNVGVVNQEFVGNMKTASQSLHSLTKAYNQSAEVLNEGHSVSTNFNNRINDVTKAASSLRETYTEASQIIKDDLEASRKLTDSIKSTSEYATKLSDSYLKSSESITKSIEELQKSTGKNHDYNLKLSQLSENLASLNTMYEFQLKNTEQQSRTLVELQETMNKFLGNLETSALNTDHYHREMEILTKRISSLNSIYGNMLSAMNVK